MIPERGESDPDVRRQGQTGGQTGTVADVWAVKASRRADRRGGEAGGQAAGGREKVGRKASDVFRWRADGRAEARRRTEYGRVDDWEDT